jgi:MFS family permease
MSAPSPSPGSQAPGFAVGAALLMVASLGIMANALVSAALPAIKDHFAGTPHVNTLVGLVVTLPSLGIVLTAAAAGWLNDRIGRQPVMLGALALYGLVGLGALLTTSLPALLVTRFLLGVAIGGTMTSAMAMIGDRFQGEARIRFMSTQAAVMSGASMVFLLTGGLLAELGWRWPFLLYAAGWMLIPVALAVLPESKPAGPAAASEDRLALAPLAIVGVSAFLAMVLFYMLPVRLPFHLASLGITSPAIAGLAVALGTLTMAAMALTYARVAASLPPMVVYAIIFGCTAIGFALIGWSSGLPGVLLGSAIAGAGYGWLFPVNNLLIMQRALPHQRGRATGFHTTCIFTGQFFSPLLSGPIIDRTSTATAFLEFGAASALVAASYVILLRRPVSIRPVVRHDERPEPEHPRT